MKPVKAYVNILKLRLNLALRRTVLNNYPVFAIIEPTLFCNLQCPVCPTGLRLGLRPAKAIDSQLFQSIMNEIGDYLFEMQLFNWGEPLLHKQTPEFIRYAKSKQIRVTLSTNLSMKLSDEYIKNLVGSGLDRLVISLDGVTQETYQKYRRGGDISLVRENMLRIQTAKRVLDIGTPIAIWQFLVFRHNQHEIEIAKSNCKKWGADQINVWGGFTSANKYDQRFCEKSTMPLLEKSDIPQYDNSAPENQFQKVRSKYLKNRPCPWLYDAIVMNPNGMVSPCCAVWDERDDFAIYSPSIGFMDIWNNESFVKARSLFSRSKKHWHTVAKRWDVANTDSIRTDTDKIDVAFQTMEAVAGEKQLICNHCPMYGVPSCLDIPYDSIFNYHVDRLRRTGKLKNIADLLPLLLIGEPSAWQFISNKLILRLFKNGKGNSTQPAKDK